MGVFDSVSAFADTVNSKLEATGLFNLTGAKTSSWDGLSPHLLAEFYPVKAQQEGEKRIFVRDEAAGKSVIAPLLDGAEMEYTLDWQSPFEQMGTEAKAPALTAMLQSGVISQAYAGFMSSSLGEQAAEQVNTEGVGDKLKELEGRTGITKLNSTQTFSGMSPIKCTMKLLFRAYHNAKTEVNDPIQQLIEWAVPKKLSEDSTLVIMAKLAGNGSTNANQYLDALLPSFAPQMIAMRYKGRLYSPMVIESISDPITSPTTSSGHYASAEVSMTLSSVQAWDKADIAKIYGGSSLLGL